MAERQKKVATMRYIHYPMKMNGSIERHMIIHRELWKISKLKHVVNK